MLPETSTKKLRTLTYWHAHRFPRAARTHKAPQLRTTDLALSQLWGSEVQNKCRLSHTLSKGCKGEHVPCLPEFLVLPTILGISWLEDTSLQSSPSIVTWCSPYVSVSLLLKGQKSFRAHPIPVWPHLNQLHLPQRHFQIQSHSELPRRTCILGGHHSTQYSRKGEKKTATMVRSIRHCEQVVEQPSF